MAGLAAAAAAAEAGARVTVVEMLPGLLPGADRDLVVPLHKRLEKMLEAILLNTSGTVAEATGENVFVVKNGVLLTPPRPGGPAGAAG